MSRLKSNITYNFVYQFLILFLPFVTAPYLSRVIGAEGVGIYSYSYSVALYFTYFVVLGLNKYGNREIASCQRDFNKMSTVFSEIYEMQILFFCIIFFIYLYYCFFIANDQEAALIQSMLVMSALFDINWLFWGMEQFKITVTRNAVIKIVTVICIFIFVKKSSDVYKYIAIMSTGYLLSNACLIFFSRKLVKFRPVPLSETIKHIKPNLTLFIPVIAVSVYRIMDKVMLGGICDMEEVGYYENAEKIINVPVALITAIGTVMLPRMTALVSQDKIDESKQYIEKTMAFSLCFSTGAAFGIIAVSKVFSIVYYGRAFERSGMIMSLLAVSIIFLAGGDVIRSQFLIPNRYDKVYLISAIAGAVINVVVNALLIPVYGANGAAIGTVCAELMVFLIQFVFVLNKLPIKKYILHEIRFLAAGIVMITALDSLIPVDFSNSLECLVERILIGALIYIVCVVLFYIKKVVKKRKL